MKRYIKSSIDLIKKLGVTADQLERIKDYAFSIDADDAVVGFDWDEAGQWIHNMFVEPSGRWEFKTIKDAVDYYGFANCRKFCQDVLKEIGR